VKYWDSSALVPLFVAEGRTAEMLALLEADPYVLVSFLTPTEVRSAIRRRSRYALPSHAGPLVLTDALASNWHVMTVYAEILKAAQTVVDIHGLRASDAIQLAGALVASPARKIPFVTADEELKAAARAEGFPVLP
jgi:predicted nucleic acid-binding protein